MGATSRLDGYAGGDCPRDGGEGPGGQSRSQTVGLFSGSLPLSGLSGGWGKSGLFGPGPVLSPLHADRQPAGR